MITGASEISERLEQMGDGTWFKEYGMRMRQGDIYVEIIEFPLAHVITVSDLLSYNFPEPCISKRYIDAVEIVNSFSGDYLIFTDIEVTIFSLAMELVGMEKLLVDMASTAEYVESLFRRCAEFQIEIGLNLIKAGVDVIWVGDDFGTQAGLLFSPKIFRSMLKPYYKWRIHINVLFIKPPVYKTTADLSFTLILIILVSNYLRGKNMVKKGRYLPRAGTMAIPGYYLGKEKGLHQI